MAGERGARTSRGHSGISGRISIRRDQMTIPPGGSCLSTSSAMTSLGVPVITQPWQVSRTSRGCPVMWKLAGESTSGQGLIR